MLGESQTKRTKCSYHELYGQMFAVAVVDHAGHFWWPHTALEIPQELVVLIAEAESQMEIFDSAEVFLLYLHHA